MARLLARQAAIDSHHDIFPEGPAALVTAVTLLSVAGHGGGVLAEWLRLWKSGVYGFWGAAGARLGDYQH